MPYLGVYFKHFPPPFIGEGSTVYGPARCTGQFLDLLPDGIFPIKYGPAYVKK